MRMDSSPASDAPSTVATATIALLKDLIRNACVNDLTPDSGQEVRNADTLEAFFAEVGEEALPVTVQRLSLIHI